MGSINVFLIIVGICFLSIFYIDATNTEKLKVTELLENCYFEGQKDALNGNIRIKQTKDGCWVWTKSCWDNGTKPIFNPSNVCNDTLKK